MIIRPTIDSILDEYSMDPTVFLPKNGWFSGIDLQGKLGLSDSPGSMWTAKGRGIECGYYRGEDIPAVAEDFYFVGQKRVIGITGDDLFDEYRLKNPLSPVSALETIDWDDPQALFRRPALCLLAGKGNLPKGEVRVAVNRKYEMTARQALGEMSEGLGIIPQVCLYSGDTEKAVASDLCSYAVDIVYSGKTLAATGLRVAERIRFSDIVAIGVREGDEAVGREYSLVSGRIAGSTPGSYTVGLGADRNRAIKKVGEESAEFVAAAMLGDRDALVSEYCDLTYALMVNLAANGVSWREVTRQMSRRQGRR